MHIIKPKVMSPFQIEVEWLWSFAHTVTPKVWSLCTSSAKRKEKVEKIEKDKVIMASRFKKQKQKNVNLPL